MKKRNQLAQEECQTVTFHYEPLVGSQNGKKGQRIAAYCRVSTLTEEQELSFETQCEYYRRYIENNPDMTLVGIYGDQGFSGLNAGKRKEFQKLIKDCEDGKIDMILVKSISRFSRNTVECMEYVQRLKKYGVAVLFEKENLNSMDPHTEMILSIYASIAQNESCSHGENIRWAKLQRAKMGDPMRGACYGYRSIKKNGESVKQWIVQEDEAKRIRLLFELAHRKNSLSEIIHQLNELEQSEGTNKKWVRETVMNRLQNEAYRGDILTSKTITLDYLKKKSIRNTGQVDQYYLEQHHEPLVDPRVFDEVQAYIKMGLLNTRKNVSHDESAKRERME